MDYLNRISKFVTGKYFWLIVVIIVTISRLATWLFPFDSDHWIFYYIGRRWFDGATLYVDAWDHKSPLIFAYNGLLDLLFGGNIVWQRIFFTLIAVLAIWLFYKTSLSLYKQLDYKKPDIFAKFGTLVFAFLANLSQFTNSGNNNENVGLIFLIATLYFYLDHRVNKKSQSLLLAGLMASFVILLKANFIILLLPIIIDLIIINRKNIYRLTAAVATFSLGPLLHVLMWALYFKQTGTFKQFLTAAFTFNSQYIRALGWDLSAPGIIIFLGILLLLLAFFAPALFKITQSYFKQKSNNSLFMLLTAVSALLFIAMAGTFYPHYFLIALPSLCLIAAPLIGTSSKKRFGILTLYLGTIALLMLAVSFKQLYNNYYGSVAVDAANQAQVAAYIKDHTNPKDKIFAYIYGATMYRLADRDSGSRFISASHLLIDYKYDFGYDFNKLFVFDIINSEAKYIVMSADKSDIYRQQNPAVMRFIFNNYSLETTIDRYEIYARRP